MKLIHKQNWNSADWNYANCTATLSYGNCQFFANDYKKLFIGKHKDQMLMLQK